MHFYDGSFTWQATCREISRKHYPAARIASALKRARALVTRFEEEAHVNPNTQTREFSLRDPDGYYVTISALPAPQRWQPARRGGSVKAG